MPEQQIVPHKITKPIQLLGAWLAGLAVINGSFLAGAATITSLQWLPAVLVIAAVVNVPLFLASLFLLQTKFRPEMQEDSFYSKYLEKKYTDSEKNLTTEVDLKEQFKALADDITSKIEEGTEGKSEKVFQAIFDSRISSLKKRFKSSRTISELYLHADSWNELVEEWELDEAFQQEITTLSGNGMIEFPSSNYSKIELTEIGREVAQSLERDEDLWHQRQNR